MFEDVKENIVNMSDWVGSLSRATETNKQTNKNPVGVLELIRISNEKFSG